MKYSVYARPNEKGKVEKVFSDCFEKPLENDVLLKTGEGDEFVHCQGDYQLYAMTGCHLCKIVDGVMVECTEEELAEELASMPTPEPTLEERVSELELYNADLLYQVCLLQLGLTEDDLL